MVKRCLEARIVLVLVAVVGTFWGCGLDETYTGLGEGALPGDPLGPGTCPEVTDCGSQTTDTGVDAALDVDYGQLNVEDLTGMGYRFDSLVLTAPLTGVIGDGVNDYFTGQIEDGLLNVVLLVSSDDRESGELVMAVGPADESGGSYTFSGETSDLSCTLMGQYYETDEPASLTFPSDVFTPPELPIKYLRLSGWFTADGTAIEDGVLDGALTEEDAAEITVMGSDFVTFMGLLDIPMDMDTNQDGTNDAWRFVGTFTASQVEVTGVE